MGAGGDVSEGIEQSAGGIEWRIAKQDEVRSLSMFLQTVLFCGLVLPGVWSRRVAVRFAMVPSIMPQSERWYVLHTSQFQSDIVLVEACFVAFVSCRTCPSPISCTPLTVWYCHLCFFAGWPVLVPKRTPLTPPDFSSIGREPVSVALRHHVRIYKVQPLERTSLITFLPFNHNVAP